MSIANKYRPNNFETIIGNENTKMILQNFLEKKEHPHSYLFFGSFGCGKTTIARVLAQLYNCEILELNSSNTRGIDSVRDVIYQGSNYTSWISKNKGFILDEVHKLTNDAQNALLKILEEPPEHIYFFLCTTDHQKLLSTIRSRCQSFEMQKAKVRDLYPFLIDIAKKEGMELSKIIARKIAETSNGNIRDSLNILEKVIQVQDENRQMLIAGEKIEESKSTIDLCRSLLKGDWIDCRQILLSIKNPNSESMRKIILSYMQKVILSSSNRRASYIIEMLKDPIYDYAVLCSHIFLIYNN